MVWGDSANLGVGDSVIVGGYPYGTEMFLYTQSNRGLIQPTFYPGIISAILPTTKTDEIRLLQISTPLAGGISGGAVILPKTGEVVGMVTGCVHEVNSSDTKIMPPLKERVQAVLNDTSTDPQSRAIIRQALETNDPWLARLVRQDDAAEEIVETIESESSEAFGGDDSGREKIEALADIICRGGEEPAAALFVLMGALQDSTEPKALAHVAKHLAFTRCGEFNVYGMVDSQLAVLERELLA